MTTVSSTSKISFPEDLVPDLFEYCDGETLSRAAGVCKSWSTWANDPNLWHTIIAKTQGYTIENKKLPLRDIYRVRHITLKNLRSGQYKTSTFHLTLPGHGELHHHVDAKTNRLALLWKKALLIFSIGTGQKEREITHLPATVPRAYLPNDSIHFSPYSLHLERAVAHKLVLNYWSTQAIFNMRTLSFEFACEGRILHEGEDTIVTYTPSYVLEIRDSHTKEVKFSLPHFEFSFLDIKDDLGIIANRRGQVIIFNIKECRKVCEFLLVDADLHGLKIINQDRVIIQTKEYEVRLIHAQTGEIIKTFPYRLRARSDSFIQCRLGKWIACAPDPAGSWSIFVIDSKQGDVLKEYRIGSPLVRDFFIIHNQLVIIKDLPSSILVYDLVSYALLNEYVFHSATYIERESGKSSLPDDQELSNIVFFNVFEGSSKYYFLDLSSGKMTPYIPQAGFSPQVIYSDHFERRFFHAHLVDSCYNNHAPNTSEGTTACKIRIANFLEQAPPSVVTVEAQPAASTCVIL